MPQVQLAVDVSNYTGAITAEQARCLRSQGVEHLIAGTQVESIARVQLEAALAAGMTVDAYVYLYWRRDVRIEVARSVDIVTGLPVGRLWLDCENDSEGIDPDGINGLIDTAIEALRPHPRRHLYGALVVGARDAELGAIQSPASLARAVHALGRREAELRRLHEIRRLDQAADVAVPRDHASLRRLSRPQSAGGECETGP
jgi:hypothetical protein